MHQEEENIINGKTSPQRGKFLAIYLFLIGKYLTHWVLESNIYNANQNLLQLINYYIKGTMSN
jgi:hypothetical protein